MSDFAPFDRITPEEIEPMVDAAIAAHKSAIEAIGTSSAPTFDNVLLAGEAAGVLLDHAWSPISHLNNVADNPALRAAHAKAEERLSSHGLWVGQNEALYAATLAAGADDGDLGWSAPQRRVRDLALRDFRLSGVTLPREKRERFKDISLELTRLHTAFSHAVLDATDSFHCDARSRSALAGVPEADIARFGAQAQDAGVSGYRIGLQAPDVQAILTQARSRQLRRRLYEAYATRASDLGPQAGANDNSDRIEQIMALRHEAAQLLGYSDAVDHSLATKMAPSYEAVESFLLAIAGPAKAAAEAEMAELREAAAKLGIGRLSPWDIAYVSERVRQDRFAFDAEEVRAYFPANKVMNGAVALLDALFGITLTLREDVPVWHPDATYYDVRDAQGALIAGVYVDLFARPGKRGGAWMDICRQRFPGKEAAHLPVAFLICNFAAAQSGRAATLHHGDVVTLLHEFGHVLHHILTEVDFPSIGGIRSVEWDAVELPSQLLENFAWDYEALRRLSNHVDTGAALPRPLFDKMLAARNFQSGMRLCRQVEFALFDLRLHRNFNSAKGARALETLAKVRREVAVIHPPRWQRFPHSFTHIFAGGYAAGYYSYLWAELLSADAFARFAEAGGLCASTGAAFRREILSRGAARPAIENFVAFRGREPDPGALLRSHGLAGLDG